MGSAMSIPMIWLPIILTQALGTTPEGAQRAAPEFQAAITARADLGWRVRDLQTVDAEGGIDLSIVMAGQRRAQRISLQYNPETEVFGSFQVETVAMPTEDRVYAQEAILLEELSLGQPLAIEYDCADFYLNFGKTGVSLSDSDFRVQLQSAHKRPGAALSSWMSELLEHGELVDLRDERSDDGADVTQKLVFVLDTEEGLHELEAELGTSGKVLSASLHHTPGIEAWGRYQESPELNSLLSSGRPVTKLRFVEGEWAEPVQLEMEFAGGKTHTLEFEEFADDAFIGEHCGC